MRKSLLAIAAALCANAATAAPPKLLIVISVDQFSADLFHEYRGQFSGGFARLAGGAVFRNGYQSHAATETCPGHSTILTGDRPARTGIVVNHWFDQSIARAEKSVYCAEDETAPGSTAAHYVVSAIHLKVPTLGDLLQTLNPASRSVAVAGKDRAAVMLGGRTPSQRWYWNPTGFTTDLKNVAAPLSIAAVNAAVLGSIAQPRPALESPPYCAARAQTYTIGGGPGTVAGAGKTVGNGRFARGAGDGDGFTRSPEYDAAVLALAAALTGEMKLGRGSAPDLLAIGLSATDYVGHIYGTEGQEMCLQLLSLDRDLGDFFDLLDRGGIDYAVAMTADHGGFDIVERSRAHIPDAANVDKDLAASVLGKAIGQSLGIAGPILFGEWAGDIYLDRALSVADRARVESEALRRYRAHPQVDAVFTKDELARTAMPSGNPQGWSLVQRARASFDPRLSGDLVVILHRNIAPYPSTSALASTHGTPWDYDRRVPILFWRPGMAPAERDGAVETVDIMPTLAAQLGVPLAPGSVDGQCLAGIDGIACPPR